MEVKQCPVKVRCNNLWEHLCMCVPAHTSYLLHWLCSNLWGCSGWSLSEHCMQTKDMVKGVMRRYRLMDYEWIQMNKSKLSMSDYSSLMVRRLRGYRKRNVAFLYSVPVPLANESLYHFIWNLTISVKPPLRWPHIHAHTNFTHPNLHSRLQSTFPPT